MGCKNHPECGGCCYREYDESKYRQEKEQYVKNIIRARLNLDEDVWEQPLFLPDGTRRRAALAFSYKKGRLSLGFNEARSAQIVDCRHCFMLTDRINNFLPALRLFLEKLCAIRPQQIRSKKKTNPGGITQGDILILDADNGIDIVLETENELNLDHRMEIFDFMQQTDNLIRFSVRKNIAQQAEPIVEKIKPLVKIGNCDVYAAPGTFLQASQAGEKTLTSLVMKYIGSTTGHIADLFCGIGTFSYPLAARAETKITAVDSSKALLEGFKTSVNRQMLHNIEILERNLFKYPLDTEELKKFSAVIFDPPRAGAAAQAKQLAALPDDNRPEKIIAVSCNPHSFVTDALTLIDGGYHLKKITLVDQFVYSNHSELVALFTK